jgi:hypothetical protein
VLGDDVPWRPDQAPRPGEAEAARAFVAYALTVAAAG